MFEIEKTEEVQELIAVTKSDSGISGPVLAKAHIKLGELLGGSMRERLRGLDPADTTVVAVERGGYFFAQGLYFGLGCRFATYNPKLESFVRPDTKHIILADSVINTGKTIKTIAEPDMLVACCVINRGALPLFEPRLYTIRVSDNSFVGSNVHKQDGAAGPDTTMRLFNQL